MRILLVEDDPEDARLFLRAAARAALNVVTAATKRAALEALAAADPPFELVVLDLWLPNGRGVELHEEIRAAARGACVVVLTGQSVPETENAIAAAGSPVFHKLGDYDAVLQAALHWWRRYGAQPVLEGIAQNVADTRAAFADYVEQERIMSESLVGLIERADELGEVVRRCLKGGGGGDSDRH